MTKAFIIYVCLAFGAIWAADSEHSAQNTPSQGAFSQAILSFDVPSESMSYQIFAQSLSGDAKEDLPRMRGILARNLAQCYKSARQSQGTSPQANLEKACEFEAYKGAKELVYMHYAKSGSFDPSSLESKHQAFWRASSLAIFNKAKQLIAQE